MNKISMALTALMLLALVAFMAPNIMALNRGKVLRNIAIWLGIFAGLGLIYQNFVAEGSPGMPLLFGVSRPHQEAAPAAASGSTPDGSHGFTSPGE